MFKNYIKIALRNLIRHKAFTFINIVGLAIGMACCIVIFLYVKSESGYDQYHEKKSQIFRLTLNVEGLSTGNVWTGATSSILWGPALKKDYPEIQDFCRVMPTREGMAFKHGDNRFMEDKFVYADESALDFFTWPVIFGDAKTALAEPFNVIIDETTAKKYFGNENPIGKVLQIEDPVEQDNGETTIEIYDAKVTAVIADIPYKSHLKPNIIVSFITLNRFFDADVTGGAAPHPWYWRGRIVHNYLMLPENYPPAQLEAKFQGFLDKYVGDATTTRGYAYHPYLQELSGIHLEGGVRNTFETGGDTKQLYMFGIIAIVVLLIACINFMNLSTARSMARAREVGIRKVVGAHRRKLIQQFLGESLLMSFLALVLALILIELINPIFYSYLNKEFFLTAADKWISGASIVAIALITGFVAGSYPAFFLSRFRPVHVLKSSRSGSSGGGKLRKALVTMQFAITIFFILGTLTLYYQLQFMQSQDLGFKSSQIVVLPQPVVEPFLQQREVLRNELLAQNNIKSVTIASAIPGRNFGGDVWVEEGRSGEDGMGLDEFAVDYDFIKTYGLEIIAGRNFDESMGTDAAPTNANMTSEDHGYEIAAIVNETMVKRFGWASPEAALGKRIIRDPVSNDFTGKIVGVVKDFHVESLHDPIEPMVFFINDNYVRQHRYASIEIATQDIPGAIAAIKSVVTKHDSEIPFEYFFADENFAQQYESDRRMIEIYGYISLLTIFIACLGLFGLASYTAEQRTKEIGIRKVLGASVPGIVSMFSVDFLKLIAIGFLISVPVGYYAMNRWLENFAYRIEVSWWLFAMAGGLALLIALATVCWQAIKAALANPIKSLRYE